MPAKVLEKRSLGEPQLLRYYKLAMEEVYGTYVRVKKDKFTRFISKEKELLKLGVEPKDFAYGVAILLERWVREKKFKTVPVNVFLGKWADDKYMKVRNSVSVTIDPINSDESVNLLWSELLVAKTYIQSNLIKSTRLCDIVEELEPILSEDWLQLYKDDKRLHIESLALIQLEEEYLVKNPNSYTDIINSLVLNGHSQTR